MDSKAYAVVTTKRSPAHKPPLGLKRAEPPPGSDMPVLTWLLAAGMTLIGWLLFRHLTGRRAPYLIAMLCLLVACGVVVEVQHRRMEARYTAAVKDLLGRKDTFVVCERLSGALVNVWNRAGYVKWTPDGSKPSRADLTWGTCRDLRSWDPDTDPTSEQVVALHVLTHEAMHLDGHYGEAEAECEAMQHDAAMAHLLGASPATGQHLAETYYRDMYPRMREGYTSGDCRKGGDLDATPGDGIWP